jgi:hypothetical protein
MYKYSITTSHSIIIQHLTTISITSIQESRLPIKYLQLIHPTTTHSYTTNSIQKCIAAIALFFLAASAYAAPVDGGETVNKRSFAKEICDGAVNFTLRLRYFERTLIYSSHPMRRSPQLDRPCSRPAAVLQGLRKFIPSYRSLSNAHV